MARNFIKLFFLFLLSFKLSSQPLGLHSIDIEPQSYQQEIGTNIQYVNDHFYLSLLAECLPEGCPHLLKVDNGIEVVNTYYEDSLITARPGRTLIGNNTIIYANNKSINDNGMKIPQVCQYDQSLTKLSCTELSDTGYAGVVQIEENSTLGYTALIMEADSQGTRPFMKIVELSRNFDILRSLSIRDTFRNLSSPEMIIKEDGGIAIAHIVELKTFDPPFKSKGCITTIDSSWDMVTHEILNGATAVLFTPKIVKSDGGYVRMWYKDSTINHKGQIIDVWPFFQKIDNKGNLEWTVHLFQYWLRVDNLEPSSDGSILGCGYASEAGAKSWGWIFKIGRDGTLEWDRKYLDEKKRGGIPPRFRDIVELNNGKLAATGVLIDSFQNIGLLDFNIALLVVDSNGCITPGCVGEKILVKNTTLYEDSDLVSIFPNPGNGQLHVKSDKKFDKLIISNLRGERIVCLDYHEEYDLSQYNSGGYILSFLFGNHVYQMKLILK